MTRREPPSAVDRGSDRVGRADARADARTERPARGPRFAAAEGAASDKAANGHDPALDARAALLLPAQLLQPGEIILLALKPSPLMIVLAPLKQLTLIALASAVLATAAQYLGYPELARRVLLGGVALFTARIFWECLEWLGRVYVLTDRRVIRVAGVLRVSVFEAGLEQVQHTEVLLSLRERLFGLGTIAFSTAGTAVAEAYWHMVVNPLDVHRTIVNALRRYRR